MTSKMRTFQQGHSSTQMFLWVVVAGSALLFPKVNCFSLWNLRASWKHVSYQILWLKIMIFECTHSSPIPIHSMCILNRRDSLEVNYLIHHPAIHKWWNSGILLSGGNVLNRAGKIAHWIKSGETRLLRMSATQAWGPEFGSQLQH